MAAGYLAGWKRRGKFDGQGMVDKVMMICISGLVLLMGLRMGSNEEVIASLGTIGLEALAVTILLWAGTAVFVTLARKILGYDKQGRLKSGAEVSETEELAEYESQEETEEKSSNAMTIVILVSVVVGLLAGYFFVRTHVSDIDGFSSITGNIMTAGLCVMLAFIGFGMGLTGTVIKQLRSAGLRVLAFPLAILIGTTVTGIAISFIIPLSVKEMLAVCYGFGWYTFAPVAIANKGYAIAGAVSFMHNVFRELGGLVLIPVLAEKIGYLEVISLPGCAAMDICMPVVERATRQDMVVYSFTVGILESLMVPLLVPLVIGL